ncbi:TrkA family potassium uptake protein [Rhodobacteraceae bacterium NNCM2]|nr:TrkA family potassium uptake protein [Coraliihabitans acroporae]
MRIVIIGISPLGSAAAKRLIEAGHDVVVIDQKRSKLDALSERFDCGLVEGDGTLPSTLREAGGEEPGALLALTNSDEDNILAAVVARSVGFERVIPQIINAELCAICDELKLDDMITPHETVSASLLDMLDDRAHSERSTNLSGQLRLMEYVVSGALVGQQPDEVETGGHEGSIIAINRGDEELFAADAGAIEEGDTLVLVTRRDDADALSETLKEADSK